MSYWSVRSVSAEMRMITIGWSVGLNVNIVMRSAPSGSSLRIESILVRTWNAAVSTSRSQSKPISNSAWSAPAVASICSMPDSVASASSMGRTTSRSISSGVEPG